nr:hypothetical protein Iba_chr05dCG1840 [Ipomoea batatas]GME09907.1 hypothetical protein Iba_scaffold9197CG0040 [Ipomoea batatas]
MTTREFAGVFTCLSSTMYQVTAISSVEVRTAFNYSEERKLPAGWCALCQYMHEHAHSIQCYESDQSCSEGRDFDSLFKGQRPSKISSFVKMRPGDGRR